MKKLTKQHTNIIRGAILAVVLTMTLGCGGHYGRLAVNDTVKKQFENYEILPDYQYYYSGSLSRPRAVLGIHKAYTLQSDLWIPVTLSEQQLKDWINYLGPATRYFKGNNGFEVLTQAGEKIGVWYSLVDWKDWATVRMIDERVVRISTPIVSKKETAFMRFSLKSAD